MGMFSEGEVSWGCDQSQRMKDQGTWKIGPAQGHTNDDLSSDSQRITCNGFQPTDSLVMG